MYVGNRDITGAKELWDSLPPVYRQCAVSFTDFWDEYKSVFPYKRHKASSKIETVHIERLNVTSTYCTSCEKNSFLFKKISKPYLEQFG